MRSRISVVAAGVILAAGCLAQTPGTDKHIQQLIDHWQWKQYWYGTTELGSLYSAGREFRAIVFWRTDDMPPSVGFCSADLGLCQFYPDTFHAFASYQMRLSDGESPQSAFERFRIDSFGQNSLLGRSPVPAKNDYATATLDIKLPALLPPQAIRDHRNRPAAEIDALAAALKCLPDDAGCMVHLLIPFYSPSDPWVPVFSACSGCANSKPMIIFMRLVDGHWWHGARDYDDSTAFVNRTRDQISKALMFEAGQ